MILLRKAYKGHYIEIRPDERSISELPVHQAQVWLDGERLNHPRPCANSQQLAELLSDTTRLIDTLGC